MKVLLGVDGSSSSDLAASLVANLTWPVGSTIEVVTAYPGTGVLFGMPGMVMAADVIQETEDAMEVEARRMVTGVARRFAAPDITVATQVVRERAATAILDEASTLDADLIVLGNRGRGPFESALLGSVSDEVVDQSHRPVLVARRDRINRILFGEDGSETAAVAALAIRRWSFLHGAEIQVLTVADIDPRWNPWLLGDALLRTDAARAEKLREQHGALAEATAAVLREAGLQAQSAVTDGNPAHRLVEAAVKWDADLIVLGTHGQSGLERLLVGSVARAVLQHAPCSVLIVPGPIRQSAKAAGAQ